MTLFHHCPVFIDLVVQTYILTYNLDFRSYNSVVIHFCLSQLSQVAIYVQEKIINEDYIRVRNTLYILKNTEKYLNTMIINQFTKIVFSYIYPQIPSGQWQDSNRPLVVGVQWQATFLSSIFFQNILPFLWYNRSWQLQIVLIDIWNLFAYFSRNQNCL